MNGTPAMVKIMGMKTMPANMINLIISSFFTGFFECFIIAITSLELPFHEGRSDFKNTNAVGIITRLAINQYSHIG